MVCLDRVPTGPLGRPLVVSVGSEGDFTFENDVHKRFPNSTIITLDGTVSGKTARLAPAYVRFVHKNFYAHSLRRVSTVDILKIDCEGCELSELIAWLRRVCTHQIIVETHACLGRLEAYDALMRTLNTSYAVFFKEPNIMHSDGGCVEFSLQRRHACGQSSRRVEPVV